MKFSVITLFPDMIGHYCGQSIMGRAQKNGVMALETINPRDFTEDTHHKVDDAPYGGGPGMVMMCAPVMAAFRHCQPLEADTRVLMTSPKGRRFDQAMARELSQSSHVVMVCGHYEGIDARVEDLIPGLEFVSVGDVVLTGGELAALVIIDATTRLLPGALGKDQSSEEESFSEGLLEYPQYTRPPEFEGLHVPEILLSGNHQAIAQWRHEQSLAITRAQRPDLLMPSKTPE